jgi:hypothetical protein
MSRIEREGCTPSLFCVLSIGYAVNLSLQSPGPSQNANISHLGDMR